MRAFISSEMNSKEDEARRKAAIETVREMGHEPVFLEATPARKLRDAADLRTYCRGLVRESHALLLIVDDTVTEPMRDELDEAQKSFGEEHIFYYFTKDGQRDVGAIKVRDRAKESHWIATFGSETELAGAVRRTLGSYVDDALRKSRTRASETLLETDETVKVGAMHWWRSLVRTGDRLSATLYGDGRFYAKLCEASQFALLHDDPENYGMPFGSDRTSFHLEREVERDDDYYLVVKRGMWKDDPVTIHVRWVRR